MSLVFTKKDLEEINLAFQYYIAGWVKAGGEGMAARHVMKADEGSRVCR